MSTKPNLDTVKSETLEAVEISKRLESFDGGLNGVHRQMAKILTANRQKRNIFTVNRQISEPNVSDILNYEPNDSLKWGQVLLFVNKSFNIPQKYIYGQVLQTEVRSGRTDFRLKNNSSRSCSYWATFTQPRHPLRF